MLTALLSLASVVVATPANVDRLYGIKPRATGLECGSHLTPDAVSKKEADFTSLLVGVEGTNEDTVAPGNFTIPINFHVVYASENISEGYVP